ncbi:MAG: N-acetylglucosamine kinase [Gammaproteobacteria bacterium]
MTPSAPSLGLGIDAGGTQTRWALASADGAIVAEGVAAGMSALEAPDALRAKLAPLAASVRAHGTVAQIHAGLTGFGGDAAPLQAVFAALFDLPAARIHVRSDIEIAYLDSFVPGAGYLIYAGTGSIGAYIDADGRFQRAGGRGVVLDDGGGGFWIAREALRHVWRNEDEEPGRWRGCALARAVFAHIGSEDWTASRQFLYGQERGAVGTLALAVAACADTSPVARDILQRAGAELARLASALTQRYGVRPLALGGRAATLHPSIEASMRAALPPDAVLTRASGHAHHGAARAAATPPSTAPCSR